MLPPRRWFVLAPLRLLCLLASYPRGQLKKQHFRDTFHKNARARTSRAGAGFVRLCNKFYTPYPESSARPATEWDLSNSEIFPKTRKTDRKSEPKVPRGHPEQKSSPFRKIGFFWGKKGIFAPRSARGRADWGGLPAEFFLKSHSVYTREGCACAHRVEGVVPRSTMYFF